jgi:hypothetical protein
MPATAAAVAFAGGLPRAILGVAAAAFVLPGLIVAVVERLSIKSSASTAN